MKLLPDDPRLTAYALGEIEDPQERHAIEQAIQADPALQAEVDSIRNIGDLLSDQLETEAAPEFSEFEKEQLQQAPSPKETRSPLRVLLSWPAASGIAAIFAVMLYLSTSRVERTDYDIAFRHQADTDAPEEVRYRVLDVEIPDEVIQGTPQPIKVPNLEPAPTQAPRIVVVENATAARMADGMLLDESIDADGLTDKQSPTPNPELLSYDEFSARSLAKKEADNESELSIRPNQVTTLAAPVLASNAKPRAKTRSSDFAFSDSTTAPSTEMELGAAACFAPPPPPPAEPEARTQWNTEKYDPIEETDFRSPLVAPLSTFSIDVDTASYANVRRFLNQGQLPPADAVRIEELINYFPYNDAPPTKSLDEGGDPFAVHMAQTDAPWNPKHHLLRIALKGYEMPWEERPASNLVFVLDVSGSMSSANKLPLVKDAMNMLVQRLDQRDRVAIVVYAGASGLVLPSTTANNTETIEHAIHNLESGGSTNAGAGIQLAYKVARDHFIEGGNNRVILCTDGDFNVGQTNRGELATIAEQQAEDGTSLTILGFGMGNYKDDMLETLSNKGKGSYAYVDSRSEARKVFLEDLTSNLFKIAKDVKIQVEFNPNQVNAYRLIGYENRRLKAEDFNNDQKKAGDIGPGHSIVALYEIVPSNTSIDLPGVDSLRYQQQAEAEQVDGEVATVKLRYKQPDASVSKLTQQTVHSDELTEFKSSSEDVRFSAAVAAFGLRLRESQSIGEYDYDAISRIAANALAQDPGGHRSEFIDLVEKAEKLSNK